MQRLRGEAEDGVKAKTEQFWSIISYGAHENHICTKHKTHDAAERAARECEAQGGAKHTIFRVTRVGRLR
jgi:hypothetical protein